MSALLARKMIEPVALRFGALSAIDGEPCFDFEKVRRAFLAAPYDILPEFEGPIGSKLRGGRGKDHPRYGRFIYAFAKAYRPQRVVEVGTFAGGTAVGWARALAENNEGRLLCLDNDTYARQTYPEITRCNLLETGLAPSRFELRSGDSKTLVPQLARELAHQVDIYLVDGDHTYEGALADLSNGLPMLKPGGFILVHDVDRARRMDEQTPEHPAPVYEAVEKFAKDTRCPWCVLKFIRKHLAVLKVPSV